MLPVLLAVTEALSQTSVFDLAFKFALEFGFNGLLVILLMWFIYKQLEKLRAEVANNTRAVAQMTLSIAFLPPAVRAQVEETQRNAGGNNS